MKKAWEEPLMGILLLLIVFFVSREAGIMSSQATAGAEKEEKKPVVVIDAGHGGNDPGKVGVNKSLEKDINLKIAKKLKVYLENADVEAVLTREDDRGLYKESDSRKKSSDMKNRVKAIEKAEPDLVVSIHQNSYHEEYVNGAQVFYYSSSAEGKELAEALQAELVSYADPENHRQAKANDSYYLLKKTEAPIAIVECGFLSNWEEAAKLQDDGYQSRVAWAVSMGILAYLH